jgi:AraC-like DNA-binding protein
MRQNLTRAALTLADEPHLIFRSLAVNYSAGGRGGLHSHPWPQFMYASKGAIRAEVDNKSWIIPPRRGLCIPANAPHRLDRSANLQLRTLYVRPELVPARVKPLAVNVSGLLHEAIMRVCEQNYLDGREATDRHLGAIILNEMEQAPSPAITLTFPRDARARKLASLFLEPDTVEAPLETLCTEAGLSRRTAERAFERETGVAPGQWRRFAALSQSLVNIAGGMKIEHAALAAGYQSRSAFSDAFAKVFGFPPGRAR